MRNFIRNMIRMIPVVIVTLIIFLTLTYIIMSKQNSHLKAEEYLNNQHEDTSPPSSTSIIMDRPKMGGDIHNLNMFKLIGDLNYNLYKALSKLYNGVEVGLFLDNLLYYNPELDQFSTILNENEHLEKLLVKTSDKIEISDNPYVKMFIERDYEAVSKLFDKSNGKIDQAELKYIIAVSLYKEGSYEPAIAMFESISRNDLLFYDYLLYYKAYTYMQNEDYHQAGEIFRELRKSYPKFRHMADVVNKEAECYVLDNYNDAIFTELKSLNTSYYRYLNTYLCKSYHKAGNADNAIYYASLVIGKGYQKEVEKVVPILEDIYSKKERITYTDKYRLARAYFIIYEYHKAKKLFEEVSFQDKNTEYNRLNYLASLNWRLKDKETALKIYQKLKEDYTGYKKEKAEFYIAKLLISMGKKDDAYSRLIAIEDNWKHDFRKQSLYLILDILMERKDYRRMFKYLKIFSTRYNIRFDTWNPYIVKMINEHQFELLVEELPAYIKVVNNNRFISQLYFWLGQSYEKLEKWEEAYNAYEKSIVHYNNHYYPSISLNRIYQLYELYQKGKIKLTTPKSPTQIEHEELKRLKDFLSGDRVIKKMGLYESPDEVTLDGLLNEKGKKALALLKAGDLENGFDEWRDYYQSINNRWKYALYFMHLFHNSGLYNRSIYFAESIVDYLNYGTYQNHIPHYLMPFMYPDYFKEHVEEISQEHNVDEKLVYSVIREESRFNHLAKSWAGAEGLMQIMPSTGRWMADKLKRSSYKPFNPRDNIYIGVSFLKELLEDFDPPLAVGAYNAGGGRMGRYVKEFYRDIDIINLQHFVENIPIKETRYYIIKVMGAYSVYQRLYR